MKKILRVLQLLSFLFLLSISNNTLIAQACNLLSGNINLGGPSHDPGFQTNSATNATALLSNGNFVIAWETRDDVDGDRQGGFFQVFDEAGTAVTSVTMPYADINPAGTGDQGTFGPRVVALNTGFVIVWTSEDGPGDVGPVGDDQTDIFFRIYNNEGIAQNASTRVSVAGEEDKLSFVLPLSTGGFVILMHIDEDDTGNDDDYFFEAYNASGVSTSGSLINITGGAHDAAFQTIDQGSAMIDLGGGNFAVAWESRDDIDGDGNGGFIRIFNANGTAVTNIITPYADINPNGTGDQATPGPLLMGLANGNFVIAWESQQGPGDIGPAADDMQDIYFRIYSSNGTPVTGTTKANSDNTVDEEQLNGIIELTGGNFAMLYHRDEDDIGNKDDYFVRTFTSAGVAAGGSFEISSGAHLDNFCAINSHNRGLIALNNGNFVVGWAARDDSDGDDAGAYYRVFNPSGAAVSPVTFPYQDINAAGTGKQSTFGPILETLPDGFTIVWQSAEGPGDVGPVDDQQDIYHRVIDNSGTALCGSTKTNAGNDAEEEVLMVTEALANGNFVVVYKDDEDDTGNKDDYFFRVIGGAPLQVLCPALGTATVSASAVCINDAFDITVSGLQNMAMANNNEQNYGVRFMAFADATSNPYSGGNLLGTVPFGNLTNGGTTATLSGVSINAADPNLFIYAILDASPSNTACLPNAQTMIEIVDDPSVSFTALADLCSTLSIQNGLGSGTPTGGVYSGVGVTDDGNGSTYSFDPSVAGIGTHTIVYSYTNTTGCSGSASDVVEVFGAPNVEFAALVDLCANAVLQTGLGGGTPMGGTYSGPGVIDDGNGMTFTFDPTTAGVGTHTIVYDYSNAADCSGSASEEIEVFGLPTVTISIPDTIFVMNGIPPVNIDGGGTPVGGVYTDDYGEIDDDGNGMTFSFNASAIMNGIGLTNTITYTYTDANGCVNTSAEEFFLADGTVDVKNPNEIGLEIFPNPTTGIINIIGKQMEQIEIINIHGQVLRSENYPNAVIDISSLPTGIYFLKIKVGKQIVTQRMVKE